MEDALFVFMMALMIAVPSFMVLGAVVNVLYRLASGKFFDFVNVPTAIVFGIYLLIWMALCWEGLAAIAITH